jgi:hypothetical protein
VNLTDEQIIAALQAAGVGFQYVDGPRQTVCMTSGSQEASKIVAAVRSLLPASPVEAWGVFARVDGKLVLQYPVGMDEAGARQHAAMYGKSHEVQVLPMGVVSPMESRAAALWRKWAEYLSKPSRKPFNLARDLDQWMKDTAK